MTANRDWSESESDSDDDFSFCLKTANPETAEHESDHGDALSDLLGIDVVSKKKTAKVEKSARSNNVEMSVSQALNQVQFNTIQQVEKFCFDINSGLSQPGKSVAWARLITNLLSSTASKMDVPEIKSIQRKLAEELKKREVRNNETTSRRIETKVHKMKNASASDILEELEQNY